MDVLLAGLKAVAEISRIRILYALSQGEMNVSEITQVLDQSQPRVSRHLKVMAEAGLISRHKEGNWVLFRLNEDGLGAALSRAIVDMLPGRESVLANDRLRFDAIRRQRQDIASSYFAGNAGNWEKLRSYHVREAEVEAAMLAMVGESSIKSLVDLGTGTGRMLALFAGRAQALLGLDQSREMLAIARAGLERDNLKHAQVRQADIYALPLANASADLVVLHQVLHFLDDPQTALLEAARILRPQGHILIVDFSPHEMEELREQHAHRRLGIANEQMSLWLNRAGLDINRQMVLPPPTLVSGKGLTVSLWLAGSAAADAIPSLLPKVNALS